MKNKVYFGLVLFYIEETNHPFFFNSVQQAPTIPKDCYQSFDRADIYVDWFPSTEKMNEYKSMLIQQIYEEEKIRLRKLNKEIVPIDRFKRILSHFSWKEAIEHLKNKEKIYLIPPILSDRMFYHEISREQELEWNSKKVALKSGVPKEQLFVFYQHNFEQKESKKDVVPIDGTRKKEAYTFG